MTSSNLPGQLELATIVNHKKPEMNPNPWANAAPGMPPRDVQLAKLLRDYDNRPSSETWSRIQRLAAEILK